ncbi:MAG: glycoside hydrolase family 99-like domain-containing protein [Paracoccaceae bacterium]|jgi:lipopolysaccharide biosynthesis protein|nr:glycoside hydrolase family 99-like domain-containing protein [Paracoccaceae bacterium]MDP7186166.1 glycoside hydrolase family 99-like domain-containing protein [Paracoccaceae bacterium]
MQQARAFLLPRLGGFWLGLRMLLGGVIPDRRQRQTVRAVLRHGGFDRRFYRTTYCHLPALHRLFCLLHYASVGERAGLQPSAEFAPRDYLRLNPDVARAGVPALWHWLTLGRGECRLIRLPDPPGDEARLPGPVMLRKRPVKACFAVCLHLYYPELWPEFSRYLGGIRLDFDLFVTLGVSGPALGPLRHLILSDFPKAEIFDLPNRGRDILPFVTLLNAGAFDGYDAVCKLHGKRSPHRPDGDQWRQTLVSGVLPQDLPGKLAHFLADRNAAVWVADGQLLDTRHWWGENRARCRDLLSRIELEHVLDDCAFPAGSVYWIKPFALGLLKSLRLGFDDFEPELGKLDGTTAHAVERCLGQLVAASGMRVVEGSALRPPGEGSDRPLFISAFYLPQFHRTAENDRWWGDGYTEWRAARQARPAFRHHLQPARPVREYDLGDPTELARQAALAKKAGIDAFCVYFYWFDGRRMLETPIDRLLTRPGLDFPFYLCWANESWRRNWDGQSGELLVEQRYATGFEIELARDLMPYLRDPRYQRPDRQRPRFVIYRPSDLPDPAANVQRLRNEWRRLGIGEVEIGAVLTDGWRDDGSFDFRVEMPPHGLCKRAEDVGGAVRPDGLVDGFDGFIYPYQGLADRAFHPDYLAGLPKNTIRGIMPGWDNTARRGPNAHIARGGNPASFRAWLHRLRDDGISGSYRKELFINAWNEWGEKAVLEPCQRFGDLNLQAIAAIRGTE